MTSSSQKSITLALQGGGAHGAFTWGVLDRLLEEDLLIEGISGTSSGAMNAAALACGFIQGGNEGARTLLTSFWRGVSKYAMPFSSYPRLHSSFGHPEWSPFYLWKNLFLQTVSPYFFNPLNNSPLKEVLRDTIDFSLLHQSDAIKLYICATNVETNRIKIFENKELCQEALLASACLPMINHAVEWKGEHYWDGGFMGNPMLEPLIYNCLSRDLLIVQVNTVHRPHLPITSAQILNRMQEITFNASFMREIRNIVTIQKLSKEEFCNKENPYADLRLHCLQKESVISHLSPRSKEGTRWSFLTQLRDEGRKTAHAWLKQEGKMIGVASSMDLEKWRAETPSTTCATLKLKTSEGI